MNEGILVREWSVAWGSADDYFGPRPYRHWEDGFLYYDHPEGYVVTLTTSYGREYVHPHRFADADKAQAFAEKVINAIWRGRRPDLNRWNYMRVVYGSQAYIDEESHIVHRERADALMEEAFRPRLF